MTTLPQLLDERFAALDEDGKLRPTKIKAGAEWSKRFRRGLLSKPETARLGSAEQDAEKAAAFDLLDALTCSGALPVHCAELHVVLAATHCFDDTLVETVVRRNVNPIEKVERSLLIVASVVQNRPPMELVQEGQRERVAAWSPMLLDAA